MMKNKGVLGILAMLTIGIISISGCIQQDGNGADDQNGDGAIVPADLTQITFLEDLAADPSWSPDGSRIIFLGMDKNTYEGGFYVINSNGTGVAKVGQWEYDHLFNPSWSPVSNKIIGHGTDNEHHPHGLFLIDLDGDPTEQIQLTAQKAEMPSWNPDGTRIAYNVYSGDWSSSKYGYESSSIWIMDVNGSGQTQLTTEEDGFCTAPSFSYDGSKIVYLKGFTSYMPEAKSAQQEPNEIWVMNSDGSDKHVIFAPGDGSTQNIRERAWNKNDEIIFSRFWYQQVTQIWVINSNGTNPQSILKPAETFSSDVVVYDDPVWDNSGTKVALTKVTSPAMPEESWQIATFSWEESQVRGGEGVKTFDFEKFKGEELEADVKWTSEGLSVSGEIVDHEVFQLPDGSYAMHTCGLGKVAYSPDGLTWTISEDDVIGEASSILKLPDGSYRAWWSVPKGAAETFDMLTAFSNDGYNWEDETMLTSPNMDDFYGGMPAVVISPDGTYRMYYTRTGPDTFIKSDLPGVELFIKRIYSAHSSDGLVWEPDPGIRIDGGEEADKGHASSGDVYIRKDGKYEMVYCSNVAGTGIAISDEGLNWTRLGSTGILGGDPVVNVFSDGTIRMYYGVGSKKDEDGNVILDRVAGVYSAVREPI